MQTNEQLKREIEDRIKAESERQKTFERLQRALRGAIQAMALTLESRDPYTAGHQQRVSDLAQKIAGEMGFDHERIEGIRMAGLIHDLGKIAVPAEILAKPTRLSDTEFSIIKTHPELGYDILKDIEFPWPVAQIVHQHHEKMNGTGYPSGLAGDDILVEARIMCVADVIEAMAFHRPYRPAFGVQDALDEIERNRGILYDPEVVDACLRLFHKKGFEFDSA
jgi:putative nucleotidyltransferase with HDIG domain